MNSTINFSIPAYAQSTPSVFNEADLIADVCNNFNYNVSLMVGFIFGYFILNYLILPRAEMGLNILSKQYMYGTYTEANIKWFFDRIKSFIHTGALFGSMFLIYTLYLQGFLGTGFYVYLGIISAIILIIGVASIVEWIRRKKGV